MPRVVFPDLERWGDRYRLVFLRHNEERVWFLPLIFLKYDEERVWFLSLCIHTSREKLISVKKEYSLIGKSSSHVLVQAIEATHFGYQSDKHHYAHIDCPDHADYTKNTPFYFRFMVLPKRKKQ